MAVLRGMDMVSMWCLSLEMVLMMKEKKDSCKASRKSESGKNAVLFTICLDRRSSKMLVLILILILVLVLVLVLITWFFALANIQAIACVFA